MASSSVVKEPPDGESLLDVTECCEFLDAHRRETIERLQKRYRAIGPLLGKVEELIAGTNTGRSARLRGYYRHWEREMFFALNALVLNSLEDLGVLFEARDPEGHARGRAAVQNPRPAEPAGHRPHAELEGGGQAPRGARGDAGGEPRGVHAVDGRDMLGGAAAAAGRGTTTRTSSRSRRTSARIPRSETGSRTWTPRPSARRPRFARIWTGLGDPGAVVANGQGGVPRRLGLARGADVRGVRKATQRVRKSRPRRVGRLGRARRDVRARRRSRKVWVRRWRRSAARGC